MTARSAWLSACAIAATALFATPAAASGAARCEALAKLRLKHTTIVSATPVAAGKASDVLVKDTTSLPAFCRVVAQVRSEADSDIGVELWLPMENWTGVFHGNGNGGFAGVLRAGHPGLDAGLRKGFATAVTDTGTAPATMLDGDPLIGHPRKWKDWGRLSTHVMTVTGKALTRAFYGRDARRSYYTGCSTGGQQGLIEALYYPSDYDAILVGAPVVKRTWGHAAVLWNYAAAHRTPGSLLSEAKLKVLNKGAIAACGRLNGGLASDPFIADPLSCRFDPVVLACKGTSTDQCLTADEVTTARAFYSGPTGADGRPLYHGWLPGSEGPGRGWLFLQGPQNGQPPFSSLFKWVFGPGWDWRGFDVSSDMARVDAVLGPDLNDATRGSLSAFRARGGKLILYHGLSDSLTAPGQTVDFYNRHAALLGGPARMRDFARMFLPPGVMHCGGGAGPDSFDSTLWLPGAPPSGDGTHDLFQALIDWRETGRAPDRVIATKFAADGAGRIEMQRPVCAYPRQARYSGSGSTHAASSFTCALPPRAR